MYSGIFLISPGVAPLAGKIAQFILFKFILEVLNHVKLDIINTVAQNIKKGKYKFRTRIPERFE